MATRSFEADMGEETYVVGEKLAPKKDFLVVQNGKTHPIKDETASVKACEAHKAKINP